MDLHRTSLMMSETPSETALPSPSIVPMAHSRQPTLVLPHRSSPSISPSLSVPPSPAPATSPLPILFFALGSDSPTSVERILVNGEAHPDDRAGPDDLPALVFSLANDKLKNKTEIVKTLLSHGADPSVVQHLVPLDEGEDQQDSSFSEFPLAQKIKEGMNPAIRYYLRRKIDLTPPQLKLLQDSSLDPLLRTRFCLIGQDLALDEFVRTVVGHCRRHSETPLSIIFAGPSGHGKSLLASKVAPLLGVSSHIVNMANLRNQEDLLQSRSVAQNADDSTLINFLTRQEGQRCVVVLEEIEKVADALCLHTLLMPWEIGKLTTPDKCIDTRHTIWICTTNVGEDIVFDFDADQQAAGTVPTRKEYLKLMTSVRKHLSQRLGTPAVSRISAILPFLPFGPAEQLALASESFSKIHSEASKDEGIEHITSAVETLLEEAMEDYIPREGARSIHRAVRVRYEDDMW
jgi:hypothetical protein